jgi:hypothetical protein
VTIENPDNPIGTIVFTALAYTGSSTELRWSALSMYANPTNAGPPPAFGSRVRIERSADTIATDATAAKEALDRITIPQEALDYISEFISPGSSLIITDEDASKETGKDTEFIVLMSGEPQGGIKMRRRADRR